MKNFQSTIEIYFILHQLSIKYHVPKLTEITSKYIKEHDLDLIFDIIKYKLFTFWNERRKNCNRFFLNTSKQKNWFLFRCQFYIESSTKYKIKLKAWVKKIRKNSLNSFLIVYKNMEEKDQLFFQKLMIK